MVKLNQGERINKAVFEASLILKGLSIRDIAKVVGRCKTSIHNDLKLLQEVNKELYTEVQRVLDYNLEIRGELRAEKCFGTKRKTMLKGIEV